MCFWANWACQSLDAKFLGLRGKLDNVEIVLESLLFLGKFNRNKISGKPRRFRASYCHC